MTKHRPTLGVLLVLMMAGAAGLAATSGTYVEAADHLDPPARVNPPAGTDRASDIADVFAWHTGTGATGRVTTILTFAGPNMPAAGQEIPCDRDVLYTIHIDSDDMDLEPNFNIEARFGEDDDGNCFVSVSGAPGMTAGTSMVVPVEVPTTRGDVDVFAGLRDDPFFFDLVGFREMVDGLDGTPAYPAGMGIRMTNDRDFFRGQNTPAIVVEFPLTAVSPTNTSFRVWATTARHAP